MRAEIKMIDIYKILIPAGVGGVGRWGWGGLIGLQMGSVVGGRSREQLLPQLRR